MDRRTLILASAGLVTAGSLPWLALSGQDSSLIRKTIPVSGALIPAIGMGTWITFDVADDAQALALRQKILQNFFAAGGTLIDSSPMYGYAQKTLGWCFQQMGHPSALFSATKVWTPGRGAGIAQMQSSEKLWGVDRFDLMMVHNMVDWRSHLDTLLQWKDQGRLAYTGITTSHGRRHGNMAEVIRSQPFDFVQFSYNLANRRAEQRLLPLAQEHGKAVIINRPFQTGALFRRVQNKPLPAWAAEIGCRTWAQFFLKFVISHPAVTCAIPATSRVEHMQENMLALTGKLPDQAMRGDMVKYFESVS